MGVVKAWLPVVLWAAVILLASDDSFSDEHSREWLEIVLGEGVPEIWNFAVRKLAHVVEYAILAALAWRAARRATVAIAVAAIVAIADETLQSFSMSRSGSPWDVLLDLTGAVLALALLRRAARARMSRQEEA
jgi:hypothetical protein